jgi:hypothetical protein
MSVICQFTNSAPGAIFSDQRSGLISTRPCLISVDIGTAGKAGPTLRPLCCATPLSQRASLLHSASALLMKPIAIARGNDRIRSTGKTAL